MIPPALAPYLWLIVAAAMLANVAMLHVRAGALVRAGQVSEAERRALSGGAAVVVVVFCLLLQVIVWLTGESRPECLAAFPPTAASSQAGSVVTVVSWGALLWWVWRGAGADRLARFSPIFVRGRAPQASYTAAQIRRAVTVIVLLAGLGGAVASRVVPPPADCR